MTHCTEIELLYHLYEMVFEQPLSRQRGGTRLFTNWLSSDSKVRSGKHRQAEGLILEVVLQME